MKNIKNILSLQRSPLLRRPAHKTTLNGELIEDSVDFDDDIICATRGIVLRSKKTNEGHAFKMYPNPAKDQVTLMYELGEGCSGKLVLYNSLGEKQAIFILNAKQKEYEFSTSKIPNGIYHYSVYENEELVNQGKLIILK